MQHKQQPPLKSGEEIKQALLDLAKIIVPDHLKEKSILYAAYDLICKLEQKK